MERNTINQELFKNFEAPEQILNRVAIDTRPTKLRVTKKSDVTAQQIGKLATRSG